MQGKFSLVIYHRVAGIVAALVSYNDVIVTAKQINQTPKTIYRAFYMGDIKLSTLNAILDYFGICVIWKFNKIETDNGNQDNKQPESGN